MKPSIIIRFTIVSIATLSLLLAAACGGDSEPSAEPQTSDTTSSVSPPAPPPAATSAPDPTAAPAPSEETINVGHRVGDRAPDYMLALTGDRQVNSADLVAQGKPVFILFHATW